MYEGTPHIWSDEGVGRIGASDRHAHLADLIDPADPAFPSIMREVLGLIEAEVELTEETVQAAVTRGRAAAGTLEP